MRVWGRDLRVGDTIAVWWRPHRDTILALRPYTGALAGLFKYDVRAAEFALCRGGMTIPGDDTFEVVARDEYLDALYKIAAGHNDPRALAQSILDGRT